MDVVEIGLEMEKMDCPTCGLLFFLSKNFLDRKRSSHESFLCPNNHSMCFPAVTDDSPDNLKARLAASEQQVADLKTQVLSLKHDLEQMETKLCQVQEGDNSEPS